VSAVSREVAALKSSLDHPVIDVDGHIQEHLPAAEPFLEAALGDARYARYRASRRPIDGFGRHDDLAHRHRTRVPQGNWWGTPARNTHDLATAVFPALLHERLEEIGIDFAVLYPSKAFGSAGIEDGDVRRGVCRGFNDFFAHTYGPYRDRLTVAGVIPMHTPEEAIAELEHCKAIGLRVVGMPEGVLRPVTEPGGGRSPVLLPGQAHWLDTYGLDSELDYDPVWRACARLGFPVTFHAGLSQLAPAVAPSISNYSHNHIGRFAERMSVVCKSLFMGGVTRRFPDSRFAFLECGVGWAGILLSDLIEHWEKRNLGHLHEHLDPALIDWAEFGRYAREYGPDWFPADADARAVFAGVPAVGTPPPQLDDWAAAGIAAERDIVDRFVPQFYFGCEADDPTTAFAFSPANPLGARLRPVFSSDIGHWDVTDMAGVVTAAHGLVRNGLLRDADFADFVFANPVALLTGANPGFFDGTPLQRRVRAHLGLPTAIE
jgi:predicted TIM-barrel fold metal-dependent hydrolase